MERPPDYELADVVGSRPGVRISNHYWGIGPYSETYFVHFEVEDADALDQLIEWVSGFNAPVHIYGSSKTGYGYSFSVDHYRRALMVTGREPS